MTTKVISVSSDDSTYYTLPGSSGDLQYNGSSADDSIFGTSFKSSQPTLVGWTGSANAYYKGLAGYTAVFKKSGTATATTGEAMSLVSGLTYEVTDPTKNVLDYNNTITVYDGVTDVTAQVESIDHLFGRITFLGTYTVVGSITIDAYYMPMSSVGTARDFTLSMTAESVDTTDFATAQANGGYMTYIAGLKTVSLDASGFYSSSNGFKALVTGRSEMLVEINPDASSLSTARGYFKAISTGQSGDNGGNEDETIKFELSVPADSTVVVPFKWLHDASTTLSTAVQKVLTSWQDASALYYKYLSDGTNGYKGSVVVTDCSLATAVDGINTFSCSFQGTGAPTAVP
jgi:predicted secreted protein